MFFFFFFQAEDGIRCGHVTGVQTCALPIWQPAVPQVEDPWVSALAQHPLCTESWPLTDSVSAGDMDDAGDVVDAPDLAAPVVPLDAGVLLTFAQPMGDLVPAADNPPGTAPATVLGDDVADYA